MNRVVVAAFVAALGCRGAPSRQPRAPMMSGPMDPVAESLVDAFTRKDVAAIRSALRAPLAYSGLLFTDPSCTQQFGTPMELIEDQLDAFAQCLVSLPFRSGTRHVAINQAAFLEYEPGIEVQIQYKTAKDVAWLTAIGFRGHFDPTNVHPTVTERALESARIVNASSDALTSAERGALAAAARASDLRYESVWLELCVDANGALTTHAVETTSVVARDVFKAQAARWRFGPFEYGGQALPVCAMKQFAYPDDEADGTRPVPFIGDVPDGTISVRPTALYRVRGKRLITPDDEDKIGFRPRRVVGVYKVCVGESGSVDSVTMIDSTSIPPYDAKIIRELEKWQFRPFQIRGRSLRVCAAFTFIYSQV